MVTTQNEKITHSSDQDLSDYLSNSIAKTKRDEIEAHLAGCGYCLEKLASSYRAVETFNEKYGKKNRSIDMRKISIYPILAIIAFISSFLMPRFFLQFLAAAIILGMKWVVDSKTTRMLIMIQDAWRKGGEKEVINVIKNSDIPQKRF